MAQRLKIIAAGLFDSEVGVDTGIAGGSSETLPIFIRDVQSGLRVPVPFSQAEVDHVHLTFLLPQADQEVVRLYIPVQEVLRVQKLYA